MGSQVADIYVQNHISTWQIKHRRPTFKVMRNERFSDQQILKVKEGIFNNNWDESVNNYKIFQTELCFHNNILLRGNKIVIPQALRLRVLEAAHEGHPGIGATKARLRSKVWWPKLDKDAETIVKSCKGCALVSKGSLDRHSA